MPQFALHAPKTQSDMANLRQKFRLDNAVLPVGVIGESKNFAYGYNGEYYYVTEGILCHLVTRKHLSFEESQKLFEALNWTEHSEPCPKTISTLIAGARKDGLIGDDLLFHFINSFDATNSSVTSAC